MEEAARVRMLQGCHGAPTPTLQQHPLWRLSHLPLLLLLLLCSLTSSTNGETHTARSKESTVPLLGAIPDTPFRCLGHTAGYYADPDTGCQVYHMCDTLERQYSYLCPNYTLFNQKFMVCDHWYMVNCSTAPTFYHLNGHIGEAEEGEAEEEQNTNTVRPEGTATKRGIPSSTESTLSSPQGSLLPSSRSAAGSDRLPHKTTQVPGKPTPTHHQPSTQFMNTASQTGITPVNHLVSNARKPPINIASSSFSPNTQSRPSLEGHFSTLTLKPTSQSNKESITTQRTFTESITTQRSSTLAVAAARESSIPFKLEPARESRQPIAPSRSTASHEQPLKQLTTLSKPTSTPIVRQSFIPTSKTTFISPFFESSTHPPRTQPVSLSPHTKNVTTNVFPPAEVTPSTLLTPPKLTFEGNPVTHTQTEATFSLATENATGPTPTTTDVLQGQEEEEESSPGTEEAKKDFPMMPASVARSPGHRFSFSSIDREEGLALTPEDLQRIVFRPLLARPLIKMRKVLSNVPSLIPIDPANSSDIHHHHFPMRIEFQDPDSLEDPSDPHDSLQLPHNQDIKIPSSGIRHPPSSQSTALQLHPPSTFLSPPTHPFAPKRDKDKFASLSSPTHPFTPSITTHSKKDSSPSFSTPIQSFTPSTQNNKQDSSFLSLPTHPFTPFTGMRQEFPTFLEVPREADILRSTSPRDTFLPGARSLPFPASHRGNRDFFIPSAEFSLLLPDLEAPHNNNNNNIDDMITTEADQEVSSDHHHHNNHHHHNSRMTMVFPAPIEPSRMEQLKINPECPRCHPQFLKPGQCHPCVVIK